MERSVSNNFKRLMRGRVLEILISDTVSCYWYPSERVVGIFAKISHVLVIYRELDGSELSIPF